jgi:glycosyltransferase involved in cell wall biosynthesis
LEFILDQPTGFPIYYGCLNSNNTFLKGAIMKKLPISVIMLTLNEEFHLEKAIENVKPWASEIFILDSGSTDRTVDIALEHGVNIAQRRFTNYGDQWNFAIENFPVSAPWTMKLDPDERITAALVDEMARVTQLSNAASGYTIPIRLWFMGKPLHSTLRLERLWKSGKCKFSDVIVNEHILIDGEVGFLKGFIEHLDSRDLSHWMDKQNRYTTMGAIRKVRAPDPAKRSKLPSSRGKIRLFLNKYFDLVPLRFSFYWLYLMFVHGVWRDGKVGRAWAHLRVEVERMVHFKLTEMRVTGRIPEMPQWPHGDFDPRIMSLPLQRKIMLSPNWERAPSNCASLEPCRAKSVSLPLERSEWLQAAPRPIGPQSMD